MALSDYPAKVRHRALQLMSRYYDVKDVEAKNPRLLEMYCEEAVRRLVSDAEAAKAAAIEAAQRAERAQADAAEALREAEETLAERAKED